MTRGEIEDVGAYHSIISVTAQARGYEFGKVTPGGVFVLFWSDESDILRIPVSSVQDFFEFEPIPTRRHGVSDLVLDSADPIVPIPEILDYWIEDGDFDALWKSVRVYETQFASEYSKSTKKDSVSHLDSLIRLRDALRDQVERSVKQLDEQPIGRSRTTWQCVSDILKVWRIETSLSLSGLPHFASAEPELSDEKQARWVEIKSRSQRLWEAVRLGLVGPKGFSDPDSPWVALVLDSATPIHIARSTIAGLKASVIEIGQILKPAVAVYAKLLAAEYVLFDLLRTSDSARSPIRASRAGNPNFTSIPRTLVEKMIARAEELYMNEPEEYLPRRRGTIVSTRLAEQIAVEFMVSEVTARRHLKGPLTALIS